MIDSYSLIIFGLGMDLVGAILIVYPILSLKLTSPDKEARQWAWNSAGQNAPKKNIQTILALTGVTFLVIGFSIQMVGNYFQYLESLE